MAAKQRNDNETRRIQRWDEMPAFATEQEEREWWDAVELGDELLADFRPVSQTGVPGVSEPRTRAVPIRFDAVTLQRLKALAERRNVGYQTLLKTFVAERLYEEEKREGLIG